MPLTREEGTEIIRRLMELSHCMSLKDGSVSERVVHLGDVCALLRGHVTVESKPKKHQRNLADPYAVLPFGMEAGNE